MSWPYQVVLSSMRAINHMQLFKVWFIKMKQNLKFSFSVALATLQVLSNYMCLAFAQNLTLYSILIFLSSSGLYPGSGELQE